MKRGTPDHPKVKRLARALGVGRAQAVGHLELLWHFAAKFSPAGDVGRFTDDDLAEACDWEGDAGAFVAGLIASGWLDPHETCRICVHDWREHADDAVNMALARAGKTFCDGSLPNTRKFPKEERERIEAQYGGIRAHGKRTASAKKRTALRPPSPPLPSPPLPEEEEKNPSGSSLSETKLSDLADPAALKFAEDFRSALVRAHPGFKPPSSSAFGAWVREARLMIAERGEDCVRDLASWLFDVAAANADADFWRSNVLSVTKLREKFDQISAKRRIPHRVRRGGYDPEEARRVALSVLHNKGGLER